MNDLSKNLIKKKKIGKKPNFFKRNNGIFIDKIVNFFKDFQLTNYCELFF